MIHVMMHLSYLNHIMVSSVPKRSYYDCFCSFNHHHDPNRSLEIISGIMIMIYSDNNPNYDFNWQSKMMSGIITMI